MSNKGVEIQKNQNVKRILQIVRRYEDMTKTRIKERTGLSFATVSSICNELVAKKILVEESSTESRIPGRTPKCLSIGENTFFAICLDLQNLGFADIYLQDIGNHTAYFERMPYENPLEIDEIIARIHQIIRREADRLSIRREQFIGVGASVSGVFDLQTETIETCAIPQWDGLDLRRRLRQTFDLPAYVDNEANLYASQLLFAPAEDGPPQNIVYLHISEGVGVGIIVNGKLLRGATGYAAEISHLPIGNPRLPCARCGNYGCAETELSKIGFLRKYADTKGACETRIEWSTFVKAANDRDPCALQVLRENGELIADSIITLMILFDPQELHIGGSILDVYKFVAPIAGNRIGRLGHHYTNIPIILETGKEQALINGITEMLVWRWNP